MSIIGNADRETLQAILDELHAAIADANLGWVENTLGSDLLANKLRDEVTTAELRLTTGLKVAAEIHLEAAQLDTKLLDLRRSNAHPTCTEIVEIGVRKLFLTATMEAIGNITGGLEEELTVVKGAQELARDLAHDINEIEELTIDDIA